MGGVRRTLGLQAECTKRDGKYAEREERKPKRSIIFSCCQGNSHPELQQSTNSTFLLFIKCVCVWVCWAGAGVGGCRFADSSSLTMSWFFILFWIQVFYTFLPGPAPVWEKFLFKSIFNSHAITTDSGRKLSSVGFYLWSSGRRQRARSFSQGLDSGKAVIFLIQLCSDYRKTYL